MRPSHVIFRLIAACTLQAMMAASAAAQAPGDRLERGDAVIRNLNKDQAQPALERMRQEFPFLATATQGYALGEVWSRPGLDSRTRQLALLLGAGAGDMAFLKIHAGYALNLGVSEDELKEIVYTVTVLAGFPRAIAASQTLSALFAERRTGQESRQ